MARKVHFRRFLPGLLGAVVVVAVGVGATLLISSFLDSEPPRVKKVVQEITLIKPPPPPPKIEEPPPPEVEEEKVDVPEPEPLEDIPEMADQPPMGDNLGLDADGSGAGDGFGLIGRKGGRSLLDGDPNIAYAARLQRAIEDVLLDQDNLRKRPFSAVAHIWVGQDGSVYRAELPRGTGRDKTDARLIDLITGIQAMAEAPPASMPQPIKLRISSRI